MQVAEDLSLQWDPIQNPEPCAPNQHEGLPGRDGAEAGPCDQLRFQLYLRTGAHPAPVTRPSGSSADGQVHSADETGASSGSSETADRGLFLGGGGRGKELILLTVIQLDDLVPVGEMQRPISCPCSVD